METKLIIMRIFLHQQWTFAFSGNFFFVFISTSFFCGHINWSKQNQKSIRLTAALNDFARKMKKLLWICVCVQYAVLSAQCLVCIVHAATNANNLCWKHDDELYYSNFKNVVWLWSVIVLLHYYAMSVMRYRKWNRWNSIFMVFSFILMQGNT